MNHLSTREAAHTHTHTHNNLIACISQDYRTIWNKSWKTKNEKKNGRKGMVAGCWGERST